MLVGQPRKFGSANDRRGSAATELAMLLPFIAFMFVVEIDYSRIFYFSQILESCARNGAMYACDTSAQAQSPYTSTQNAALANATGLSPAPTVSSTTGTDGSGNNYVRVTVTWTFRTLTSFPGVPSSVNLSRTVQMRMAP